MATVKDKRVYSGCYTRFDGVQVFAVMVVADADTGEDTVIYQDHIYAKKPIYHTITKASFCELVEVDGKRRVKFRRQARRPVDGRRELDLMYDGFEYQRRRPKKREWANEEEAIAHEGSRSRRHSQDYYAYAKDLAEHFKIDLRTYNLCVEEKRPIGVFGKKEFDELKEDLLFLRDCRKTVLRDYNDYFKERFFEGKSIRRYAEEHGLNRGSVDYLQRKFFNVFAAELEARDKADGNAGCIPVEEGDE